MYSKRIIGIVLSGALCACSGGLGNSSNPMPGTVPFNGSLGEGQTSPLPDTSTTKLQVRLTIPRKTSAADYVSPNTQSIVIKEGKKTIGSFDTTRKTKGCAFSRTKGTLCTFVMSAVAGKHKAFTIDTYSLKNGKGHLLADARVVQTIAANKLNKLKLTLNGVVSSIVVGLSEPQPIIGTSTTMQVVVSALDASGATIIGTGKYVPSILLADSDTSGATLLSGTLVTSPSTSITLAYNGANIVSATISASAKGIPATSITPATMRPTTKAGVTVSGAAAFSVVSDASGNVAAYIPIGTGLAVVKVATHGKLDSTRLGEGARAASRPMATLPLSIPPNECAPDLVHAQVYCMSFASNVVSIVKYNAANVLATPTLVGTTTTDAPPAGVSFSGATCVICGIAFDPTDNAYIISTANGYELWPTTPGATTPLKTLPAPISENFGYNALTDQIFSAWYGTDSFDAQPVFSGLDLIDIPSGDRYQLNDVSLFLGEPDAAAVDTKTNIGISPEEVSVPIYIDNLNVPTAVYTAPTPQPNPLPNPYTKGMVGSYSSPVAAPNPGSSLITQCDETYTATDSVEDLGFFGAEFCNVDYIAVAQLPTSSSGMLAFSNYVAAELPATPNGNTFIAPLDPHAVLVANIPGICPDCGVLFNYDKSYLAVVNLNALLALNPGGGELDVPTSNPLTGIVAYIATGVTSPPSSIVRKLAEANHRHRKVHR